MSLVILAAADRNWGIGFEGGLPWKVPEDLKWFKQRTLGKTVVMGRKTVDTLPSTLPGRRIVTLSNAADGSVADVFDLGQLLFSLDDLGDEVIVAGGAQVYAAMLPYCYRAEITRIKGDYECDTHMVDLSLNGWTLESVTPLSEIADIEQWIRIPT